MPVKKSLQDGSRSSELGRSASYNHIPQLLIDSETASIKRTISEVNLSQLAADAQSPTQQIDVETGKSILRQASLREKAGRRPVRNTQPPTDKNNKTTTTDNNSNSDTPLPSANISPSVEVTAAPRVSAERPRKAFSKSSFANLTLKPWKTSRSPSPVSMPSTSSDPKSTNTALEKTPTAGSSGTSTLSVRTIDSTTNSTASDSTSTSPVESTGTTTPKRGRRPASIISLKGKNQMESKGNRDSSQHSLRRRASWDRLVASVSLSSSKQDVPPVPQVPVSQPTRAKPESPKKKDELWHVFRALDVDYQKFASKSTSLKVNVLRSSLLPVLSRILNHPSNHRLRPEDLDRRTNILNRWWTGLLELLNGRNGQSITGTDRPVYLESIVAIMTRPEWRVPFQSNVSGSSSTSTSRVDLAARSHTSLESTGSDFLAESIHHNIRNTFNQNLLSQIAYSIDRMSVRHTPASLVSFCGKTCAYAFFFCPDVAGVLIRLWNIPPTIYRNVINEFDVGHNHVLRGVMAEEISSQFPPAVRTLSFSGHSSFIRSLRRNTMVPLAAAQINWFGPWAPRWAGRDTDLFFIFLKHFYLLITDMLPAISDMSKRIYVPGFIPVHAQMLIVLQNTLSKHTGLQPTDALHSTANATFDDLLDGADTPASLPLRQTNSLILMSESRLIMTLRDFIADSSMQQLTKQLFVQSFCNILKLGARKTSLFDHNACFALCDFVEELIPLIPPYCRTNDLHDPLDWDFWLDVCLEMLKSNNSLTEVRTFAFIFAGWAEIIHDPRRKERLCIDMLLGRELFTRYFGHWSPMVRGYYHRLICWRLARHDGTQQSDLDIRIYQTLYDRLGQIWDQFIAHQSIAEKGLVAPVSTAPCTPAPGRRLIIIRNDYFPPAPSMFVCLDNILPPSVAVRPSSRESPKQTQVSTSEADSTSPQIKKTWKMLRTIFKGNSNPKPGEVTPPGSSSPEVPGTATVNEGRNASENTKSQQEDGANPRSEPGSSTTPRQAYTFRFCLEWIDRQRWPSRNRQLYPPSLPAPARLFLHALRKPPINISDSSSGSRSHSRSGTGSDNGSETDSAEEIESQITSEASGTDTVAPLVNNASKNLFAAAIQPPVNGPMNKYAGRALAEWAMVVSECDNFFERRRDEGVPCDRLVEVPTLGADSFRK
ncbi:hypothetical protein McanMca71_005230 [Microsporum canis]|uniref:Uncharacterized protein n=1 Tax=Arthroderma otae (strain ATCC MYA-4605 / CBS 113480) TaxID=554155 RepID=C5FDC2_ARTOC|nr:conserved hypothetical protein [Microsporum canis CBS 113480]EEQ27896.1 conserved hypothetical protein [Microsporum canis CBS 113480]